jgi:flagellar hook assembly protein FlgD
MKGFLCGPNPFNPNQDRFTIEYTLTQASDVKIYVISLDGEQQWQYHALENDVNGGTAGFHQIEWNGLNRYGESLANGPYSVIISARHGGKHKILKQKLLVLK